ncbi:MAG: ATP-dependent Clp protease proteolytic subunit [bacterium]|nr:ATP-dependent Clp protease proteolytic subunit [bacterium]
MKRVFSALWILSVALWLLLFPSAAFSSKADTGAGSGDEQGRGEQTRLYLLKLRGEVDQGLTPFISRVVRQADEQGIRAIIIEINTFGGRIDAAVDIRDVLLKAKTLTIAYVNERAISAGALICLACRKIVMAPAATIGAATPVIINPFNQRMEPASEKVISYFRKEMKATAERNHRPPRIAEAMVDPEIVIQGLSERGKPLTLTTSEALRHKVADFEISGGVDEIVEKFHLLAKAAGAGVIIEEQRANWAEKFLRTTSSSLVSSMLLTIGLLALLLELRTPTLGIAGAVGLLCLAVFFWGHVILKLVGWEEVVLLLIGAVLLLLEVLVIPGFGLTGILGLLFLAAGFTLSLVGRNPTVWEIAKAGSHILTVVLIALAAFALSVKFLTKSAAIQRLVLHTRFDGRSRRSKTEHLPAEGKQPPAEQPGAETAAPEAPGEEAQLNLRPADQIDDLGQEGVALTNLRPAGKAAFGNKKLNVVSEGDFIDQGCAVRIVQIEGNRVVVRKVDERVNDKNVNSKEERRG